MDFINEENTDLLHFAARAGWVNTMVKCLREYERDINMRDNKGRTPLHNAVEGDAIRSIHFLLQYKSARIDVNAQAYEEQLTALAMAASDNNILAIKALAEHVDTDVNICCAAHETPLYKAVARNFEETVVILCAHPSININIADLYGTTPLHIATFQGNVEITSTLLNHPLIQIDLTDHENNTALQRVEYADNLDEEVKYEIVKLLKQHQILAQ